MALDYSSSERYRLAEVAEVAFDELIRLTTDEDVVAYVKKYGCPSGCDIRKIKVWRIHRLREELLFMCRLAQGLRGDSDLLDAFCDWLENRRRTVSELFEMKLTRRVEPEWFPEIRARFEELGLEQPSLEECAIELLRKFTSMLTWIDPPGEDPESGWNEGFQADSLYDYFRWRLRRNSSHVWVSRCRHCDLWFVAFRKDKVSCGPSCAAAFNMKLQRKKRPSARVMKTCLYCGTEFEARRSDQRFCSNSHRTKAHYERKKGLQRHQI